MRTDQSKQDQPQAQDQQMRGLPTTPGLPRRALPTQPIPDQDAPTQGLPRRPSTKPSQTQGLPTRAPATVISPSVTPPTRDLSKELPPIQELTAEVPIAQALPQEIPLPTAITIAKPLPEEISSAKALQGQGLLTQASLNKELPTQVLTADKPAQVDKQAQIPSGEDLAVQAQRRKKQLDEDQFEMQNQLDMLDQPRKRSDIQKVRPDKKGKDKKSFLNNAQKFATLFMVVFLLFIADPVSPDNFKAVDVFDIASIDITPKNLNFDNMEAGLPRTTTLTVANIGDKDVSISPLMIFTGPDAEYITSKLEDCSSGTCTPVNYATKIEILEGGHHELLLTVTMTEDLRSVTIAGDIKITGEVIPR